MCKHMQTTSFGSSQPSWWRRTCRTWKLLPHHILGNAPQYFAGLAAPQSGYRKSANRSCLSYKRLPAASEELPHVRESYCASWSPDLEGNNLHIYMTDYIHTLKPGWLNLATFHNRPDKASALSFRVGTKE